MRAFLGALLLSLTTVTTYTAPMRTGVAVTSVPTCPAPNLDGSVINAPTTCTISARGFSWFFDGFASDRVNYNICYENVSHCGWSTGRSIARDNGGNMYWKTQWSTCGANWQEYNYSGNYWVQGPGLPELTNFRDTTNGRQAGSWARLGFLGISPGDSVEITAAPSAYGFNCWPTAFTIGTPVTLTLNNAKFNDVNNGDAMIYVRASGVTLTTDSAHGSIINIASHQHDICEPLPGVRIYPNEPHTTIGGASTSARLTIQNGEEGILTSYGDGMTKLAHLTISNVGAGGLCHPIYIGNGAPPSPFASEDPTMRDSVSDVVIVNPINAGPAAKFDDACDSGPCQETNLAIYCTVANDNSCDMKTTYDGQCGGQHDITYSIFENYGYGSGAGYSWAMVQLNWGQSGCPANAPATTLFHFDHDVWIVDGQTSSAGPQGAVLVCANQWKYGSSGKSCDSAIDAQTGIACITNSEIIDNTTTSSTYPVWPGYDVGVDTGCTTPDARPGAGGRIARDSNTYYAGRAAACGVVPNWPSDGKGCAFPYVPRYMASADPPSHEQLVAMAHAAGECGTGTVNDPIRRCKTYVKYLDAEGAKASHP